MLIVVGLNIVVGWDIGGVNTKAAVVVDGRIAAAQGRAFELQRAPESLAGVLQELAAAVTSGVGESGAAVRHAVTMTAELSQMFRTKREGVHFVLDALAQAFPSSDVQVYAVDGRFLHPDRARDEPLKVAAANWAATARAVAARHPDAILVDTGSTTTDVIAIAGGQVAATGWTDPDRLASGELVYTGALRTPTEAIASHIWVKGRKYGVSAEGFALSGDVHVWRGDLAPADYTVPTPDGRGPERIFAGERLRRVICADPELVDEAGVSEIAQALARAQSARITEAIIRVRGSRTELRTAVVTGLGAFLGAAAAKAVGLDVVYLADEFGTDAAHYAPAAAVALLLAAERASRRHCRCARARRAPLDGGPRREGRRQPARSPRDAGPGDGRRGGGRWALARARRARRRTAGQHRSRGRWRVAPVGRCVPLDGGQGDGSAGGGAGRPLRAGGAGQRCPRSAADAADGHAFLCSRRIVGCETPMRCRTVGT